MTCNEPVSGHVGQLLVKLDVGVGFGLPLVHGVVIKPVPPLAHSHTTMAEATLKRHNQLEERKKDRQRKEKGFFYPVFRGNDKLDSILSPCLLSCVLNGRFNEGDLREGRISPELTLKLDSAGR